MKDGKLQEYITKNKIKYDENIVIKYQIKLTQKQDRNLGKSQKQSFIFKK